MAGRNTETDTQKSRNFVNTPMEGKPVTDVPGIGKVAGEKLARSGYPKAENVFGKYLSVDGNEPRMTKFLGEKAGTDARNANRCITGLREYKQQHPL